MFEGGAHTVARPENYEVGVSRYLLPRGPLLSEIAPLVHVHVVCAAYMYITCENTTALNCDTGI